MGNRSWSERQRLRSFIIQLLVMIHQSVPGLVGCHPQARPDAAPILIQFRIDDGHCRAAEVGALDDQLAAVETFAGKAGARQDGFAG